jgi:hypothetical protein
MSQYHPKLVSALKIVLSSKDKEEKYFRIGVAKILENHLDWMSDWIESSRRILNKLDNIAVASSEEDDMALCQLVIDEWERQDLAVGMQYNALCKKFKKLMTVERKAILAEEIQKQKEKIEKLVHKANELAKDWRNRLSTHTYYAPIATKLSWLVDVTSDELIANYERWEKLKF